MTTTTTSRSSTDTEVTGPTDPVGPDLTRTLRALKLGGLTTTLPERLVLARQRKMGHAAFLQLLLSDEVARRESRSAMLRARTAGLDPTMRLETWDEPDDLTYDRTLLSDLTSLRFTQAGHGALLLGPVGVGKTHLATALGHIAIRRRLSVHASRADKLFTRLRAARLDNSLEAEMRKLARVDVLILDDFALRPLDATETNDFYELVVERHRKASTIVTSNREPAEWLTMMSDALLAQSAVDRLTSGAHTLIIEGPSYRQRDPLHRRTAVDTNREVQGCSLTPPGGPMLVATTWSHHAGKRQSTLCDSAVEPFHDSWRVRMQKVTPADVAEGLTEFWSQQVVGSANGNLFKVAKGIGSTTWHTHEDQEETFFLLRGQLTIQLRSGDVELSPGDLFVIPRGVEHCPHAEEEAHFLLVGPEVTSNAAGGKPTWSYGQPGGAQSVSE